MQKSFWAHLKSLHTNSANWVKMIRLTLLSETNRQLLLSLKAVTTKWKPLVSVPHASVTYLSVTKLVRVVIVPTL